MSNQNIVFDASKHVYATYKSSKNSLQGVVSKTIVSNDYN